MDLRRLPRWVVAALLVAGSTASCGACGRGESGGEAGTDTGSYDFDFGVAIRDGGTWDGDYAILTSCPDEPWDPTLLQAAFDAMSHFDDGTIELPLTTHGCMRVLREVSGGVVTHMAFIAVVGGDPGAGILFDKVVGEWTRDASGVVHGTIEDGADVFSVFASPDQIVETEDLAAGRVVTEYRHAGTVVERFTRTRVPEGAHEVREGIVGGALTTVDDYTATDGNYLNGGDTSCLSSAVPCDAATSAMMEVRLQDSLNKTVMCLQGLGARGRQLANQLRIAREMWNRSHEWWCYTGTCAAAHWGVGAQLDPASPYIIEVNTDFLNTAHDPRQVAGTFAHEFWHGVLGGHDDIWNLSDLSPPPGTPQTAQQALMAAYTDQVTACEHFCFGGHQTRCMCAECLNVRPCDEPCASQASCVERDDAGVAIMSEAVAAACVMRMPDGGVASSQFFPTMADCMGACASGECKSYSRSSDPTPDGRPPCAPGCQ